MIDSFSNKNFFLSNFFPCEVVFDGILYGSAESAFQSAKVKDIESRKFFVTLSPSKSKKLGRKVELREDWENIKDDVMFRIVHDKFNRNENLKELLLETGEQRLVEGNYWNDTYWGVCNGVGENKLGKILMMVRHEIRYKK